MDHGENYLVVFVCSRIYYENFLQSVMKYVLLELFFKIWFPPDIANLANPIAVWFPNTY